MAKSHTAFRVFLTLWVVFNFHWATDFVREHFLVLSVVDRGTVALDGFEDMHPDIFVHTNGHSYHGANPGASYIGAIPYLVFSPLVDAVVERDLAGRPPTGEVTAQYDDPRAARQVFYQQARERGLDVRFGLIGLITMVFGMAPFSALGGVVLFKTLEGAGVRRRWAIAATMLYAFGTPVFLRSAFLNQNLMVGIAGLTGFSLLWNPGVWCSWSERTRLIAAGVCGGFALLCDYSGGLLLAGLGVYGLVRLHDDRPWPEAIKTSLWYVVGALPPILLLWHYQWAAFGFPFYPPQHYMPPVEWSDLGYQGVSGPRPDLFAMLLLDPRFGLFVTTPLALVACAAPFVRKESFLPTREMWFALGVTLAYVLFFSMVHYTRLQYITGLRYLAAVLPFVVLPAFAVLLRMPRVLAYGIALVSVIINWGMAMGRFQEQESSILATLQRVILGGPQLPALNTLSKMSAQYLPGGGQLSATFAFLMLALALVAIWTIERPWKPLAGRQADSGS